MLKMNSKSSIPLQKQNFGEKTTDILLQHNYVSFCSLDNRFHPSNGEIQTVCGERFGNHFLFDLKNILQSHKVPPYIVTKPCALEALLP